MEEMGYDWLEPTTGHSGETISTEQAVPRTRGSWRVKTADDVVE